MTDEQYESRKELLRQQMATDCRVAKERYRRAYGKLHAGTLEIAFAGLLFTMAEEAERLLMGYGPQPMYTEWMDNWRERIETALDAGGW